MYPARIMKKAVFKWFQIVLVKNKNAWKSTDFQAFESFVMLKCDPGGTRTHDPQLRRLLLYPAELRDRPFYCGAKIRLFFIYFIVEDKSTQEILHFHWRRVNVLIPCRLDRVSDCCYLYVNGFYFFCNSSIFFFIFLMADSIDFSGSITL